MDLHYMKIVYKRIIISIPNKMKDFNIDVYVIGSKDGKFSKQSNIINVKI